VGLACVLCATRGEQLTVVEHGDVDNVEGKAVSDRLQWHDNNIHRQDWKHTFEDHSQKDFVKMVHIVFMNHLGMKECHYNVKILICCVTVLP